MAQVSGSISLEFIVVMHKLLKFVENVSFYVYLNCGTSKGKPANPLCNNTSLAKLYSIPDRSIKYLMHALI